MNIYIFCEWYGNEKFGMSYGYDNWDCYDLRIVMNTDQKKKELHFVGCHYIASHKFSCARNTIYVSVKETV